MQIIIDFKNTATDEQIQQFLTDNSCTVLETFSSFDKVFLVEGSSLPPVTDLVESVINNEETDIKPLAYPKEEGSLFSDVVFSTTENTDWWKMASVRAPNYGLTNQTYQRRGTSAVIYLVDSGVDVTHPEFEFATIQNLWSFNDDFSDSNGHGTALASVMCGKTCGIADPVVKSVKIFQQGTSTKLSHFLGALDSIINDLSNNTNKLSVVNMSWGIGKDQYVENKIKVLLDAGVVVIAAAGNSGVPIENVTPASMLEVFTLGAYSETLSPCDLSNYTGSIPTTQNENNYGELDAWGPGSNIRHAVPGGSYGTSTGTSFAAAIHSSAVAYNSHLVQLPDGSFPSVVLKDLFAASISTGKKDILNLSDPKYALSKNIITVFYSEPDGFNYISYEKPSKFEVFAVSGIGLEKLLAPAIMFDRIELIDSLPEGFRQEGLWILGSKTVSEVETFSTTAKCYNVTNEEFLIPLTLKIIPESQVDQYTIPSNVEDYFINDLEFYPININKN